MTMARSEKHGSREKKLRNFNDKLNLNETAQQQQTNLQWQLLKTQCHKGDDKHGRMQKHEDHRSKEARGDREVAPQAKPIDGCVNHLLILAQSAEIIAQSEDSLVGVHTDDQNKGSNSNVVDQVSQNNGSNIAADDSCEISQRSGFCYEVMKPRLTQIRKQARHKYLLLDQKKNEDSKLKEDVHGKTIRLSQIKHQARCKGNNDLLLQEKNEGHKDEQLQEKNIRLCQMKHLARLKGKSTIKERTEEHAAGHLHCDKFEDNKNTKVIARQAEEEGIRQGDSNLHRTEIVPAHKLSTEPIDLTNSERQKEFGSAKGRMRLTQLRREVRLGNQCYVRQGPAEN